MLPTDGGVVADDESVKRKKKKRGKERKGTKERRLTAGWLEREYSAKAGKRKWGEEGHRRAASGVGRSGQPCTCAALVLRSPVPLFSPLFFPFFFHALPSEPTTLPIVTSDEKSAATAAAAAARALISVIYVPQSRSSYYILRLILLPFFPPPFVLGFFLSGDDTTVTYPLRPSQRHPRLVVARGCRGSIVYSSVGTNKGCERKKMGRQKTYRG